MAWNRWEPERPPAEAYSRVTNPERFAPLHDFAEKLLDELESKFMVKRTEGYGIDRELESIELQRPSVRLVPAEPDAAPLVVVFTAFPGLGVRAGHWYREPLPTCGCDACDETVGSCQEQLSNIVSNVTKGRFAELIELPRLPLPIIGGGWLQVEHWNEHGGGSQSRTRLSRKAAQEMLRAKDRSSYEWKPWTGR